MQRFREGDGIRTVVSTIDAAFVSEIGECRDDALQLVDARFELGPAAGGGCRWERGNVPVGSRFLHDLRIDTPAARLEPILDGRRAGGAVRGL